MKLLFCLLLVFPLPGLAQATARYPSSVATLTDLLIAKNNAQSTLTADAAIGDTTIQVASGSKFADNSMITIGTEIIKICTVNGNTLNVCLLGRGAENTSAAFHSSGSIVRANITAQYHNQLAAEVLALEAQLGTNLGNVLTRSGAASGDLGNTWASPQVQKILGLVVDTTAPTDGNALVWNQASSKILWGAPSPPTGEWIATLLDSAGLTAETITTLLVNRLNRSVTIQEVWCETDAGTISLQLQRDDGSAADVLASPLTCSSSGVSTTSFASGESTVAHGDRIDFVSSSPAANPKRVTVAVRYR